MTASKIYSYVRFSSKRQLKGDSLKRQLEGINKYKKKLNLELDTSISLFDYGLSGYNGANLQKGALGAFFDLVNKGKIAKNSVLIIENIDRLSRQKPTNALQLFLDIINAGITIVVLHNNKEFTKETLDTNMSDLYMIIGEINRAHSESSYKSKRLKATFKTKREKVAKGELKFTRLTPAWIEISNDRKDFKLRTEVCKAIQTIYELKKDGFGEHQIERIMNQKEDLWKPAVSNRNKTGGWRKSYITKLLHNNRQLIGEYQLYEIKEGKRVKVGEPIENYFPSAIDINLFYEVQRIISSRRANNGNGGGRISNCNNLFTHIVKCKLCGSPMHYIDKGQLPKGGKYLQCDASRRKLENGRVCHASSVRYNDLEKEFFSVITEIDIDEVFGDIDQNDIEINRLKNEFNTLSDKIEVNERRNKRLFDLILEIDNKDKSLDYHNEREKIKDKNKLLKEKKQEIGFKINELKSIREDFRNTLNKTKKSYERLASIDDPEKRLIIRSKLKVKIKSLVKEITVLPFLSKDEAYIYYRDLFDDISKKNEKARESNIKANNSFRGRVYLSSIRGELARIKEEQTDLKKFGGEAYVRFNGGIAGHGLILKNQFSND